MPLLLIAVLLGACAPALRATSLAAVGEADAAAGSPAAGVASRTQVGVASWYGPKFAGRRTSNGEIFDPSQLTAAHLTLPFGTRVRVTNLATGSSVVVRINDRGPYKPDRIIDLSQAAAEAIGMARSGLARVRIEPLALPDGLVRIAAGGALHGYEVATPFYPVGQLLVLAPRAGGDPVVVRVVTQQVPTESGADVLVAHPLFAQLGDTAEVHSE
jgi:rare lipoprotein A